MQFNASLDKSIAAMLASAGMIDDATLAHAHELFELLKAQSAAITAFIH